MKNVILMLLLILIGASNIKAQELSMFPGVFGYKYFEDSNKITKWEFESRLKTNDIAYGYWKKHKNHSVIGLLAMGVGTGLVFLGSVPSNNITRSNLLGIGGVVCYGTAVGFMISTNKLRAKAILEYNKKFDISSIKMGITPNGVGLVCSF